MQHCGENMYLQILEECINLGIHVDHKKAVRSNPRNVD